MKLLCFKISNEVNTRFNVKKVNAINPFLHKRFIPDWANSDDYIQSLNMQIHNEFMDMVF